MNNTYIRKNLVLETYGVLMADLTCVVWAYLAAVFIRFRSLQPLGRDEIHILIIFCIILFCVIYNSLLDYNREFTKRGYYVEFMAIIKRNATISIIWGFSLFVFKEAESFSRLVFGYFIIINTLLTYISHAMLKKYFRIYYGKEKSKTKVMVVTDHENSHEVIKILLNQAEYLYEISGVVVWDRDEKGEEINGIMVVASREDMLDKARQMPLDEIFIYLPDEKREVVKNLIMDFEVMGIICHYCIDTVDLDIRTRRLGEVLGFTVITYAMNQIDYKHRMIKRAMDLAGGLAGITLTALVFPFVAVAIKIESGGPVFFSQIRVGKNGRRFKIYKFRSMSVDAEDKKRELLKHNEINGPMFKIKNDPRVTRVGKFLRRTSIDELPQFFNVLKGDMSLVGTRPPTEDEFEKYSPYYRRRLCMTPGMTGMWQVSGRSEIDNFDEVVELDLKYIDYWSLSLDLKIILQTIKVVLGRKGAR